MCGLDQGLFLWSWRNNRTIMPFLRSTKTWSILTNIIITLKSMRNKRQKKFCNNFCKFLLAIYIIYHCSLFEFGWISIFSWESKYLCRFLKFTRKNYYKVEVSKQLNKILLSKVNHNGSMFLFGLGDPGSNLS